MTQVGQALATSQRLDEAVAARAVCAGQEPQRRDAARGQPTSWPWACALRCLQQAREQVAPALLEGRFAIFSGPSGRGKTLLARIVQRALILEHGMPAVWLNWRQHHARDQGDVQRQRPRGGSVAADPRAGADPGRPRQGHYRVERGLSL